MNQFDFYQILVTFAALIVLTPLLGSFLAKVFTGQKHILFWILRPLELVTYRVCGIDEKSEMNWKEFAKSLLIFNFVAFVFLFLIQVFQSLLPLNPQGLPSISWPLAFNTAVSFVTNTNWQSYSGENTLSYFVQMFGLCVQNFLSAAVGIAVLLALVRGLARKNTDKIGNFWVDITRTTVYVLLPLAFVMALVLVGQGVIQNFSTYETAETIEGTKQTIPMGPAASQIAIKQLGTNGGGFFNANSAHPFENPTPFSNWLELIAILLIPSALTFTFGVMVGDKRQGFIIFLTMMVLLVCGLGLSLWAEYSPNPIFHLGALMEGKETRFGITNSIMWSTFTTAASNGSVNAMHSSLSPLGGAVAMFNMMVGEVIFGGVGAGMYGMLLFVILTVFMAGLMVGRTPEYLGKKIEAKEVQMAILAILATNAAILLGTGISCVLPTALASLGNKGPHGFSEILYAFTSAAANNGSAFAGLNANSIYYNVMLGLGMLIGRFAIIVPVLAIAGNLAQKKTAPISAGTFRTDGVLFILLLMAIILIVGGLTFFPGLALGPLVEHMLMRSGRVF